MTATSSFRAGIQHAAGILVEMAEASRREVGHETDLGRFYRLTHAAEEIRKAARGAEPPAGVQEILSFGGGAA